LKIYSLKRSAIPKIAVLVTGLTAAILAATVSPQADTGLPQGGELHRMSRRRHHDDRYGDTERGHPAGWRQLHRCDHPHRKPERRQHRLRDRACRPCR